MSRPIRFAVILVLAAVGTGLAAVGGWRYARVSAPVAGPIILISIDTLRADHLPAYGYTGVRTPAIDALADDGLVFERAYSHAPQTLPAHAALLSGRLPFENGVRDNVGFVVKAGERMLPQLLRERGFATGGVVSSFVLRKETGISQGFDFFDAEMPPSSPDLSIGQVQRDGGESEAIAEHWLDSVGTSRVFLFLHLYEPHKPYTPPDRFKQYAPYDGEIAYSDEIVGRLMAYLKSHQLYDRSTIVLLSDHGEGLGDHGEQEHGLFVYEEAIHVPLIIKQEGNAGKGRRVPDLVQHVDLVPTLLDLVKAPAPGNLAGRSLKPLLEGTGQLPPATIYSEALYARYHFGWSELLALTDQRYRYIKAPHEELYDLSRDPHERTNIADQRTQVRSALRSAIDTVTAGATIQAPGSVSAEARERLQSLGYVGAQASAPMAEGDSLPDPKDKLQILEQYRAAVDFAVARKWPEAIALLQKILRDDPEMADVWSQLAAFALRIDRYDLALDAYHRYSELQPQEPAGYIGAAAALLKLRKLDEARDRAALAIEVAAADDHRSRASAHEMLARIALAKHDADTARAEAAQAHEDDPAFPLPDYIEGRILYDQGKYADALPLFEKASADSKKPDAVPVAELHFYTADTLARLERYPEAEAEFGQELRFFPQNTRARGSLAMLYQADGRPTDAEQALTEMIRIVPTPDSYALAARLFTMFGNRNQAEVVRADAKRLFADAQHRGSRSGRP
ncbi:MAG TPA: sulfatase-like hydrolase/transferase [Vicinamibacterales bacterium]